jgi:hypothetical protein
VALNSRHVERVRRASRIGYWLGAPLLYLSISAVQKNFGGWPLVGASLAVCVLSIAGYLVALVWGQTLAEREVNDALTGVAGPHLPIILFLRSFDVAKAGLVGRAIAWLVAAFLEEGPGRYDSEEEIADAVRFRAMFVAIGNKQASYGASKILVKDDHWKGTFGTLADEAQLVFMMPGPSASVLWEIGQILNRPGLLAKTIFIMPREGSRFDLRRELKSVFAFTRLRSAEAAAWAATVEMVDREFRITLPRYNSEGCYFRFPDGHACEVVALEPFTRSLGKYAARGAGAGHLAFDVEEVWRLAR